MAMFSSETTDDAKAFTRNVVASFFANILFTTILGGGLYIGYRKKWFDLERLIEGVKRDG